MQRRVSASSLILYAARMHLENVDHAVLRGGGGRGSSDPPPNPHKGPVCSYVRTNLPIWPICQTTTTKTTTTAHHPLPVKPVVVYVSCNNSGRSLLPSTSVTLNIVDCLPRCRLRRFPAYHAQPPLFHYFTT